MAQKIYANSPVVDQVIPEEAANEVLEQEYAQFYNKAQETYNNIPNLKGMSGMDAISILENMGLQVEVIGNGKVKNQSVKAGEAVAKVKKVVLELSWCC